MIIGRRARKLEDATDLIAAIHAQHSACIWIGPPQPGNLFVPPSEYESFVADLEHTVTHNGCRYISSADKTDRHDLGGNTKDDHYSKPDAEAWARKVLYELDHPVSARRQASLNELFRSAGLSARTGSLQIGLLNFRHCRACPGHPVSTGGEMGRPASCGRRREVYFDARMLSSGFGSGRPAGGIE